jgi:16S rRNA (uracil1498-N3)-methyltransferase
MSRLNSFYLSSEKWFPPYILKGAEAHHLSTVLRIRPGTTVRLFDGSGREGSFSVEESSRKTVCLAPQDITCCPPRKTELYVAPGWTKSARRGWFLEKAVELGAAGIFFWQAGHSQGTVPDTPKESWTARMITAAKQCGTPWLPELGTEPGGLKRLMRSIGTVDHTCVLWEGEQKEHRLTPDLLNRPGRTLLVLGPEGGFAREEEESFADLGLTPYSLGPRVLRWETAAILCLGLGFIAS